MIGDCPISAAVPTIMADEPAGVSSGVRGHGRDGCGVKVTGWATCVGVWDGGRVW